MIMLCTIAFAKVYDIYYNKWAKDMMESINIGDKYCKIVPALRKNKYDIITIIGKKYDLDKHQFIIIYKNMDESESWNEINTFLETYRLLNY